MFLGFADRRCVPASVPDDLPLSGGEMGVLAHQVHVGHAAEGKVMPPFLNFLNLFKKKLTLASVRI